MNANEKQDREHFQSMASIDRENVRLKWLGPYEFVGRVTHGVLIGFKDGRFVKVLPEGYKHPQ